MYIWLAVIFVCSLFLGRGSSALAELQGKLIASLPPERRGAALRRVQITYRLLASAALTGIVAASFLYGQGDLSFPVAMGINLGLAAGPLSLWRQADNLQRLPLAEPPPSPAFPRDNEAARD